jgi:hypothetical protein
MQQNNESGTGGFSRGRILAALAIGLFGALIIWGTTPYNNFIIGNAYISDSFLPLCALFLIIILILVINPVIRWLKPGLALNIRQIALILIIMMVASVPASSGFLRTVPYSIAQVSKEVSENKRLAAAMEEADLPPSLFTDEIGYKKDIPAAKYFVLKLRRGDRIPWEAWVRPFFSWSGLGLSWFIMLLGMGGIVLIQWQRNERLAFPLLAIQQTLIESPDEKKLLPPIFYNYLFWIGLSIAFIIHLFRGLNVYFPQSIPAIPISWDLSAYFTERPLSLLSDYVKVGKIHFVYVGVAYLMSNRVSFSIWFFMLAYAGYTVIGQQYFPPYNWSTPADHRAGATMTMAIAILWLGRDHWKHVFRCLLFGAESEEEKRDRNAAILFVVGCVSLFAWFFWCGAGLFWSFFYVLMAFVFGLVITRIVAETGLPLIGFHGTDFYPVFKMIPIKFLSAASAWLGGLISSLFVWTASINPGPYICHALALDKKASPRYQMRLSYLLIIIFLLAILICGSVHIFHGYHHSRTLDGKTQPVSSWGAARFTEESNKLLLEKSNGKWNKPVYNQTYHVAFGATLAAALQWACMVWPKWPIHPVGLLMVGGWGTIQVWVGVFFGWLLRNLIVFFGGSRLYTSARPIFIGLIIGEILAAILWVIVPPLQVLANEPYRIVPMLNF